MGVDKFDEELALAVPVSEVMERGSPQQAIATVGLQLAIAAGIDIPMMYAYRQKEFGLAGIVLAGPRRLPRHMQNGRPILYAAIKKHETHRTLLLYDGPSSAGLLLAATQLRGEWTSNPDAAVTDGNGNTIGKIVASRLNRERTVAVSDGQGRDVFRSVYESSSRLAIRMVDSNTKVGTLTHSLSGGCCGLGTSYHYSVMFSADMTLSNKLLLVASMCVLRIAETESSIGKNNWSQMQ